MIRSIITRTGQTRTRANRNLPSSSVACAESREHFLAALFNRKTKEVCEELIKNAMLKGPDEHKRQFIEKAWWITRADWANYG